MPTDKPYAKGPIETALDIEVARAALHYHAGRVRELRVELRKARKMMKAANEYVDRLTGTESKPIYMNSHRQTEKLQPLEEWEFEHEATTEDVL